MSERDMTAAGLRVLGAWLFVRGLVAAPELIHVRTLPPDLGIPEVIVVALQVLVGLRLMRKGGTVATWLLRADPAA